MKAVNIKKYGDSSQIEIIELQKPIPKEDEILVKLVSTTVTSGDARIRSLNVPNGFALIMRLIFGWGRPKGIPGGSFAGIVKQVGSEVRDFEINDKIFGFKEPGKGAHAEYLTIKTDAGLSKIPKNLELITAAAIAFGGNTSLYFLRDLGKIKENDKVLINGASGALGLAAVQLAKYFGAEVTAVSSSKNHDLLKQLGADEVIDYNLQKLDEINAKFDLIYDTVGKLDYKKMKKNLTKEGKFLAAVAGLGEMIKSGFKSLFGYEKFATGTGSTKKESLEFLKQLIEEGKYKIIIDSEFNFDEIAKAHDRVDSGHKVGSVVVRV